MSGILCFILGEIISILSGSFGVMMTGRILQACGNGVLVSMAQVLILSIFPAEEKGSMMGLYGLATTAAPVIAPALAGKIYDKMGIKKLFVTGSGLLLISNIGMFFITMSMPLPVAAAWNVLRNISIGCLMMPLLTWGTGFVDRDKVADASSLLTSLRTISGSIGATVFVSIMMVVGNRSADTYGEAAQMHGLNIAFISMSAGTLILLLIAIFGINNQKA